MSDRVQFSVILAPIDFAEAAEGEEVEASAGFVADAGNHRVAFSPGTVRAFDLAANLAKAHGAALHLLHAVPPMRSSAIYQGPVSVPAGVIDEIHDRARQTSMAAMSALVSGRTTGLDVELCVAPGEALAFVLERARTLSADLIVMAASGRSRVARLFVGSTADRIIRAAPCPVMVVPADRAE